MNRARAIRLVAMREVTERGRSKGYVLSLLFTLFLLLAGFVLPAVFLGNPEAIQLALVGEAPDGLEPALRVAARSYETELVISSVPDRGAAEAAVTARMIDAALDVPADLSGPGELIVLDQAGATLQGIVNLAVIGLRAGTSALPPSVTALEPPSEEDMTALIFANAGIILMFIGIFSYGNWVLTGVVEEKQSRVVEVILSTVRPRDLLMGKVLGIGLLALGQLVVLVAAGIVAAQLIGRLSLPPTTAGAVVQLLGWFILGFAFYSTAMGFLGALASRVDEASTASLPVTMVATLAYILSIVVRDPGAGRRPRSRDDVPAAVGADGRAAPGGAGRHRAVGDRGQRRADARGDLGHVRRRRAGVLGRRAPHRRADPAPGRLARLALTHTGRVGAGTRRVTPRTCTSGPAEAGRLVVVHQARRLHQRVADRGADEPEPRARRSRLIAFETSVSDGISPMDTNRLTIGRPVHERPQVVDEASSRPRAAPGSPWRCRWPPRPSPGCGRSRHRPGAGPCPRRRTPATDRRVEPVERAPVARALPQDRGPGESRLGALEDQQLEQVALVPDRDAPLQVVVGAVLGVGPVAPAAAVSGVRDAIGQLVHDEDPSRAGLSAAHLAATPCRLPAGACRDRPSTCSAAHGRCVRLVSLATGRLMPVSTRGREARSLTTSLRGRVRHPRAARCRRGSPGEVPEPPSTCSPRAGMRARGPLMVGHGHR